MSTSKPYRIHLVKTESTNSYARALPIDCDVTLVTTDHQTAGRGQRGNTWESEAAKNLLFSLILRPQSIPAAQQFALCELISVTLCDVLSRYVADIRIKWPNDIYHRDRKLCGILIEHDLEGMYLSRTIIGVGLNVNQAHFTSNAPNPISLCQILGHEVNREALLEEVIQHFMELYTQHTSPTLNRATLHEHYTHHLYRRGVQASYRDIQGPFAATLRTVELDGRLILEDQQGNYRSYLFKEVSYEL